VVVDPEVTQLNQSILAYKNDSTTAKLGRQRIILDKARHVGNVGWRQNEQTFDAVSNVNTSIPYTTLTYAFLDNVHGITTAFDADVSDKTLGIKHASFSGDVPSFSDTSKLWVWVELKL